MDRKGKRWWKYSLSGGGELTWRHFPIEGRAVILQSKSHRQSPGREGSNLFEWENKRFRSPSKKNLRVASAKKIETRTQKSSSSSFVRRPISLLQSSPLLFFYLGPHLPSMRVLWVVQQSTVHTWNMNPRKLRKKKQRGRQTRKSKSKFYKRKKTKTKEEGEKKKIK